MLMLPPVPFNAPKIASYLLTPPAIPITNALLLFSRMSYPIVLSL